MKRQVEIITSRDGDAIHVTLVDEPDTYGELVMAMDEPESDEDREWRDDNEDRLRGIDNRRETLMRTPEGRDALDKATYDQDNVSDWDDALAEWEHYLDEAESILKGDTD